MKRMSIVRLLAALALLPVLAFAADAEEVPWKFSNVSRIVAIGDVHGDYDSFVELLQQARLIDKKLKWIGKDAHLVQTGDVPDRGPHSRKVFELLMSLEKQALKSKGRVHALIGNHEAMNIYGDLRYVSKEEYASYQTDQSERVRDQVIEAELKRKLAADPSFDENKYRLESRSRFPLGVIEHRLAFSENGELGRWIRGHNAIVQINDLLFLHGGISPKYASQSVPELNARIRAELADLSKVQGGVAADPEGPLWYRDLALGNLAPTALEAILKQLGVNRMVVGHTVHSTITPRYSARVLCIDTGMLEIYNGGNPTALVVEFGRLTVLENGRFRPLSDQ